MKVFISWSKPRSQHIAHALREWLPMVLPHVEPFVSSQDIGKGDRGIDTISANLQDSVIGLVCLTPENLDARWILFESGALSKITSSPVCTFLYELTPTEVQSPLNQFQHTVYSKTDCFKLIQSINKIGAQTVPSERLIKMFDLTWPSFEEDLKKMPPVEGEVQERRSDSSKLDELLDLVRTLGSRVLTSSRLLKYLESDLVRNSKKHSLNVGPDIEMFDGLVAPIGTRELFSDLITNGIPKRYFPEGFGEHLDHLVRNGYFNSLNIVGDKWDFELTSKGDKLAESILKKKPPTTE